MTTSSSNFSDSPNCGEIDGAASILVQMKKEQDETKEEKSTLSNTNSQESVSGTIGYVMSKSAWSDIFNSVKQDLSFIENFISSATGHVSSPESITLIDNVFQNVQSITSNGYMVILYSVTTVCNEFRKLLQQSFAGVFERKMELRAHVTLRYKIIHYINKYESHIWQEQLYYCKNSSPENELVTFKTLLNDVRPLIEMAVPSERVMVLDAIQRNMICIQMTGLLARHAYRHIMHIMQHLCNVKNSGCRKCSERSK